MIVNNNLRLTKINPIPNQFNRVFPRRSQQFDPYETSTSPSTTPEHFIDEKTHHIHQSQELLDGRYVIPSQQ